MLTVEGLQTSYGQSQVLFGVDLEVRRGEVVTLLGRNGMGKTTTIRSIMGMTPPHGGRITFEGQELRGLTSFRIAKLGLGLVPEGRCIFPSLTVWENLTATSTTGPRGRPRWTTDAILELFPWIPRAKISDGRPALRRRAADAGDRARADDQPGAVDPGRGNRGTCAHHPQRDLEGPAQAQAERAVDPAGRQESSGFSQSLQTVITCSSADACAGVEIRARWETSMRLSVASSASNEV